jgi:hypothetical protein
VRTRITLGLWWRTMAVGGRLLVGHVANLACRFPRRGRLYSASVRDGVTVAWTGSSASWRLSVGSASGRHGHLSQNVVALPWSISSLPAKAGLGTAARSATRGRDGQGEEGRTRRPGPRCDGRAQASSASSISSTVTDCRSRSRARSTRAAL